MTKTTREIAEEALERVGINPFGGVFVEFPKRPIMIVTPQGLRPLPEDLDLHKRPDGVWELPK